MASGRELYGAVKGFLSGFERAQMVDLRDKENDRADERLEFARAENARADERLGLARKAGERADTQLEFAADANERADARLDLQREQSARADEQLGLQRKQDERAQATHELNTEVTKTSLSEARAQARRQEAQRAGKALLHAIENDQPVSPEVVKSFTDAAGLKPGDLVSKEFREDLSVLEGVAKGEDVDEKRAIEAANNVFRRQIIRGRGEEFTEDGKSWSIKDKRITKAVPSPDGKSMLFELEVTAEDKDGAVRKFRAPMTENRRRNKDDGTEDDLVMEVPVDKLVGRVKGSQMVWDAINRDPSVRGRIEQAVIAAGGEVEEEDVEYAIESYNDGDKEITVLTKNGVPYVDIASAPREAGGSGYDPSSDFKSSDSNSINRIVGERLADSYTQQGVPVLSEDDNKEQRTIASRIAERLYVASRTDEIPGELTHAEAADTALQIAVDARRAAASNMPDTVSADRQSAWVIGQQRKMLNERGWLEDPRQPGSKSEGDDKSAGGGKLTSEQKQALKMADEALSGKAGGNARPPDEILRMLVEQYNVPEDRAKRLVDRYRQ